MEQRQGRYSIIVLLLLVTLVVGFSTYTVYRRAGDSVNTNSFLKPTNSPRVLGDQTTLNEPTLEQTPVIPSVYDISEENSENTPSESLEEGQGNNSSSDSSDNKNVDLTQSKLTAVEEKANLIVSQVENGAVKPEELFSPVLVDFFGAADMQKVFEGVKSVKFSNFNLTSDTQATSDCVLTEEAASANYTCYFSYFEQDWYLYKTELK